MIVQDNEIPMTTDEWIRERMADDYGAEQDWHLELPNMEAAATAIRTAARTARDIMQDAIANAEIGR